MKSTTGNILIVRCLAVWLAASLLAPLPTWSQKPRPTAEGTVWPVKYEAGDFSIKQGTQMAVTVGNATIHCQPDEGRAFAIPVVGVKEVTYDVKVRRRLAEAAAVAILSLGATAVFAALKTKKHFVNVVWSEGGSEKEVVFKVGKGEYAAFLADLQRVTGKEWKNLAQEREMVQQELKTNASRKIPVQLDRRVQLSDGVLQPGRYQLVLLERPANRGEAYFFAGDDVNVKKIAASAIVEILLESPATTDSQVEYREDGAATGIAQIRLRDKTLRFP